MESLEVINAVNSRDPKDNPLRAGNTKESNNIPWPHEIRSKRLNGGDGSIVIPAR